MTDDLITAVKEGMTFRIWSDAHLWPSLAVFNSFLATGRDDHVSDPEAMVYWHPVVADQAGYDYLVGLVDDNPTLDVFDQTADYEQWFTEYFRRKEDC